MVDWQRCNAQPPQKADPGVGGQSAWQPTTPVDPCACLPHPLPILCRQVPSRLSLAIHASIIAVLHIHTCPPSCPSFSSCSIAISPQNRKRPPFVSTPCAQAHLSRSLNTRMAVL